MSFETLLSESAGLAGDRWDAGEDDAEELLYDDLSSGRYIELGKCSNNRRWKWSSPKLGLETV